MILSSQKPAFGYHHVCSLSDPRALGVGGQLGTAIWLLPVALRMEAVGRH